MRHQLFDSLVSVRESHGDKPHLGLGLHIVMLIAEFHRGQVAAENLDDGSGVSFVVELPCGDAG
jgi:K+-sensing histidine kinase KdpD